MEFNNPFQNNPKPAVFPRQAHGNLSSAITQTNQQLHHTFGPQESNYTPFQPAFFQHSSYQNSFVNMLMQLINQLISQYSHQNLPPQKPEISKPEPEQPRPVPVYGAPVVPPSEELPSIQPYYGAPLVRDK